MKNNNTLLRSLPKVDELIMSPVISDICKDIPHSIVVESVREVIDNIRNQILAGILDIIPKDIENIVLETVEKKSQSSLRMVINGTGIVLHTNLGRAKMSNRVACVVAKIVSSYSTLEYDLENAKRGSRYSHVEKLITKLTGAESAMVVNNNAAAVMLILGTMCKNKEVIISRGELVEIGGSFRIPEIMEQSNSKLIEVGTTNKTHLADYKNAISPEKTAAFLKVHTSNFKIMGFTKEIGIEELAVLSKQYDIPVIHDIGSGSLIDLQKFGILDEPTVMDSLKSGADVVSFSGDKLLGGPQAGIIVGKKKYIDAMKKNPLTRAVRIDKLSLAALEETFRGYLDSDSVADNIPTMGMLALTIEQLEKKAEKLNSLITAQNTILISEVTDCEGQVGGGSVPTQMLKSKGVSLWSNNISVNKIEQILRLSEIPIIGHITKDKLILDVRTIDEENFIYISLTIKRNFSI